MSLNLLRKFTRKDPPTKPLPPSEVPKLEHVLWMSDSSPWRTPPTGTVLIYSNPFPPQSHCKAPGHSVEHDLLVRDSDPRIRENVYPEAIQSLLEAIAHKVLSLGCNTLVGTNILIDPFHVTHTGTTLTRISISGLASLFEPLDTWIYRTQ